MRLSPHLGDGTCVRLLNARAPIRICDLGGWTDTWFAEIGAVCNIAVYPHAEVQIIVSGGRARRPRIIIHAENFGDRYVARLDKAVPSRHPLIEACIRILHLQGLSFEVNLYSEAPAGASTGTSAAVSVALLGALDLLTDGRRTAHEIAALAHRVETEELGLQCGIQDQLCSAYGGICFIEMFKYPFAAVSPVALPDRLWWELESRLMLIYLGRSHASSAVHGDVIRRLESPDSDQSVLKRLRRCAVAGKEALFAGDLEGFGRAMIRNTEAQAELHPALISTRAQEIIALARHYGVTGWKVNGAGGEGGSLTILCSPLAARKRAFLKHLEEEFPDCRLIPTYLARTGLRRWASPIRLFEGRKRPFRRFSGRL